MQCSQGTTHQGGTACQPCLCPCIHATTPHQSPTAAGATTPCDHMPLWPGALASTRPPTTATTQKHYDADRPWPRQSCRHCEHGNHNPAAGGARRQPGLWRKPHSSHVSPGLYRMHKPRPVPQTKWTPAGRCGCRPHHPAGCSMLSTLKKQSRRPTRYIERCAAHDSCRTGQGSCKGFSRP